MALFKRASPRSQGPPFRGSGFVPMAPNGSGTSPTRPTSRLRMACTEQYSDQLTVGLESYLASITKPFVTSSANLGCNAALSQASLSKEVPLLNFDSEQLPLEVETRVDP
jgi:hypothetical protein